LRGLRSGFLKGESDDGGVRFDDRDGFGWRILDRVRLVAGASHWRFDVSTGALRLVGSQREELAGQRALWRGPGALRAFVADPREMPDGSALLPRVPAGRLAWVARDGDVVAPDVDLPPGGTTTIVLAR
jgi:hypothetical protein